MKRLTKEYSLKINDYIDVKYGSVNREKPIVIYLEGKTWLSPNYVGDYETTIDCIIKKFKNEITENIKNDDIFENKFIFDFDVKAASLRENKKSFVSFDIFLKQPEVNYKMLKELKSHIINNYKHIIDNLAYDLSNHTFSLSKTKR